MEAKGRVGALAALVIALIGIAPVGALAAGDGVIVFDSHGMGSAGGEQLFTIPAAGGTATQISDEQGGATEPSFSPDGGEIAFIDGEGHLAVIAPDGSALRDLTPGLSANVELSSPSWSPDGTRIAFDRIDFNASEPQREVWIVDASDGSGARNLTEGAAPEREPSWSPSGEQIAFVREGASGGDQIWTAQVQSGAAQQLTSSEYDDSAPSWSPDGERIAFSQNRGGHENELWSIPSAGGEETELTETSGVEEEATAWTPDGAALIVEAGVGSEGWATALFRMPAAGGGEERIAGTDGAHDPDEQALGAGSPAVDPTSPPLTAALTPAPISVPVATVPKPTARPVLLVHGRLKLALRRRRTIELGCEASAGTICKLRATLSTRVRGEHKLLAAGSGAIKGDETGALTLRPTAAADKLPSGVTSATLALTDRVAGLPASVSTVPVSVTDALAKPPTAVTATAWRIGGYDEQGGGAGTATLSGTVDPQGSETSYHFEYGPLVTTPEKAAGSGSAPLLVTSEVSGLPPGERKYRLVAQNAAGVSYGAYHAFRVDPPVGQLPAVATPDVTAAGPADMIAAPAGCTPLGAAAVTGTRVLCSWNVYNPQPPVFDAPPPIEVRPAHVGVVPTTPIGTIPASGQINAWKWLDIPRRRRSRWREPSWPPGRKARSSRRSSSRG